MLPIPLLSSTSQSSGAEIDIEIFSFGIGIGIGIGVVHEVIKIIVGDQDAVVVVVVARIFGEECGHHIGGGCRHKHGSRGDLEGERIVGRNDGLVRVMTW